MADEKKITILDFQIKDSDVVDKLAASKKQVEELRVANSNLNKELKKLVKTNAELSKDEKANADAIAKNNAAINERTTQITKNELTIKSTIAQDKKLRDSMNATNKENKTAIGYINSLKKQVSDLTKEYNSLTKEEVKNEKIGGELKKQIDDLTKELKDNSTQLEKQKLSIGDYKNAFSEAISEAGGFGDTIVNVFTVIKTNPLGLLLTALSALVGAFAANTKVIDFFSEKFGFLTKLFDAFVYSIEAVAPSFSTLKDVAVGVFDKIGEALSNPIQLIKDLGQLIIDNIINRFTGVVEVFKAIAQINFNDLEGSALRLADASLQVATGVKGVATAMANGVKQSASYLAMIKANAEALSALDREETKVLRRLALNSAENKKLIRDEEALKNIRDDEFKAIQKRIAANEELFKIEQERNGTELKDAEQLLSIEERRVKEILRQKGLVEADYNTRTKLQKIAEQGILTEEQINKLGEARQKVYELQEESIGRQNEFITNQYQLVIEGLTQVAEKQTQIANNRIAGLETELLKVESNTKEELSLRSKLLNEKAKLDLIALNLEEQTAIEFAKRRGESIQKVNALFANRRKLIVAQTEKDIDDIYEEYRQIQYDRDKEGIDNFIKLQEERVAKYKEQADNFLKQVDLFYASKAKKDAESLNDGTKTEQQIIAEQSKNQLDALEARLSANKKYQKQIEQDDTLFEANKQKALRDAGVEEIAIITEIEKLKYDTTKKSAEAQQTILQSNFQAAKAFTEGVGTLFEMLALTQEDGAKIAKAAALAQIAIDTASAISTLVPTAVKVAAQASSAAGPAAPAVYAAVYTSTLASGIASIIANIAKATQILGSFELGGEVPHGDKQNGIAVGGQRHSSGGTTYVGQDGNSFNVEKGEKIYVLKRSDSARINTLSNENVRRGGRSFYALGGQVTANAAQNFVQSPMDYTAFVNAMKEGFPTVYTTPATHEALTNTNNSIKTRKSIVSSKK